MLTGRVTSSTMIYLRVKMCKCFQVLCCLQQHFRTLSKLLNHFIMSVPTRHAQDDMDMIALLEKELKTSDDRYLHVRSQLLEAFTSNAQLLEYTQYVEDQLAFYKRKALRNDKKNEILATKHCLPPVGSAIQSDVQEMNESMNSSMLLEQAEQSQRMWVPQIKRYQDMVDKLSTGDLTMDHLLSVIASVLKFDGVSIYSISPTTESIACEASTLEHLEKNNYSVPLSHGFLAHFMKHKRSIIIPDVNETPFPFDSKIDDRFFEDQNNGAVSRCTKTVCLEPLFGEKQEMVGILEMVHCTEKNDDYEKEQFKSMLRFSRCLASALVSAVLVKREFQHSKTHMDALFELAKVMGNSIHGMKSHNIETFIERVRRTVYKSIQCDKVAVFIVDEMTQELWCKASDDVSGIRLPIGAGIVGHTVTSGQTLNIRDAYKDSRFNPEVDRLSNYRTKTILCVPIQYNRRIIGAMECVNKTNGEFFSDSDAILLNQMAKETAPLLQNKFMESALRIISQGLSDSSSREYLSQFMHEDDHILTQSRSSKASNERTLGTVSESSVEPKLYSQIKSGINYEQVCTWDFDYFSLMEDGYQTAIGMIVYMFDDLQLLDRFQISEHKLTSFLFAVKQHYYDNPYHNFLHAFSVVHICYLLLKKTSLRTHFEHEPLDILSIAVAAVCHDLEHPGLTNAYQVNSGSPLAMRYNDKSVLENHHAHIAAVLLHRPEMSILDSLNREQQASVRKAMISIILHTDMSYHQDIVTQLSLFADRTGDFGPSSESEISDVSSQSINAMDRLFLSQAMVHLGDISNPVMEWEQSRQWSQRVITEFVSQSKREKEEGLEESLAFVSDESKKGIAKVQMSFIDYVAKPLWKNAQSIAPELKERLQTLDKNRAQWFKLAEGEGTENEKNQEGSENSVGQEK